MKELVGGRLIFFHSWRVVLLVDVLGRRREDEGVAGGGRRERERERHKWVTGPGHTMEEIGDDGVSRRSRGPNEAPISHKGTFQYVGSEYY